MRGVGLRIEYKTSAHTKMGKPYCIIIQMREQIFTAPCDGRDVLSFEIGGKSWWKRKAQIAAIEAHMVYFVSDNMLGEAMGNGFYFGEFGHVIYHREYDRRMQFCGIALWLRAKDSQWMRQ